MPSHLLSNPTRRYGASLGHGTEIEDYNGTAFSVAGANVDVEEKLNKASNVSLRYPIVSCILVAVNGAIIRAIGR